MEDQILALSNIQVRFIVGHLGDRYALLFDKPVNKIHAKPSNVNYRFIKQLLIDISHLSEPEKERISELILKSEIASDIEPVVAMDIVTGAVLISGMAMVYAYKIKLATLNNTNTTALNGEEELLKIVKNPTPVLETTLREFFNQSIAGSQILKTMKIKPMADIVILTAVETEFAAVCKHLKEIQREKDDRTKNIYKIGKFNGYRIAVRCTEQGNYKMALEADRALQYFSPQVVLLVGIAGSRKKAKVTIGDVVIVTRVYSYESGKESKDGFLSRDVGGPMNHELLEEAKDWAREKEWQNLTNHKSIEYKVVPGSIASGEKVVIYSKSRTAELIKKNSEDTIAIEMEGVGLSVALHALQNVKGINIRGISDLLDGKDQTYDNGDRELAAENASAFAFYLISKLDLEPKKETYFTDPLKSNKPETNLNTPNNINNSRTINTEKYVENDNSRVINTREYIENNQGVVNINSTEQPPKKESGIESSIAKHQGASNQDGQSQILTIRTNFKDKLVQGNLNLVLNELNISLKQDSRIKNEVLNLLSRYLDKKKEKMAGVLKQNLFDIKINNIRIATLDLIDKISESDLIIDRFS